jgi:hypothetical protein
MKIPFSTRFLLSILIFAGCAVVLAADSSPTGGEVLLKETFEDESAPLGKPSKAEISRVEPGAEESRYALKVQPTAPGGVAEFPVTVSPGTTYKVSANVKLANDARLKVAQFIIQFPKGAYLASTIPKLDLNSTDWTYVEGEIMCSGEGTVVGTGEVVSVGSKAVLYFRPSSSAEFEGEYFIDDLKLETVP